jgi:hypothetical protein
MSKRYRERLYIVEHIDGMGYVYRASKKGVFFTADHNAASRYILSKAQAISLRIGGGVVTEVNEEDGNEQATE